MSNKRTIKDGKVYMEGEVIIPANVVNANHDLYTKECLEKIVEDMKGKEMIINKNFGKLNPIGVIQQLYLDEEGNLVGDLVIDNEDFVKVVDKQCFKDFAVRPGFRVSPDKMVKRDDGTEEISEAEIVECSVVRKGYSDAYDEK